MPILAAEEEAGQAVELLRSHGHQGDADGLKRNATGYVREGVLVPRL